MKWSFFILSLLALFFANNVLFWIPGPYDWSNFTLAAVATALAIVFAWFSSRRFVASEQSGRATWKEVVKAPPATICIFILS